MDPITLWMEHRQELADEMLGILDHLDCIQPLADERQDRNRLAQIEAELKATDV